jgi:hypothetical protein
MFAPAEGVTGLADAIGGTADLAVAGAVACDDAPIPGAAFDVVVTAFVAAIVLGNRLGLFASSAGCDLSDLPQPDRTIPNDINKQAAAFMDMSRFL